MAQADSLMRSACMSRLHPELLSHNRIGLEREALRVDGNGAVAQSPHPQAIGDKLLHPAITVDFSEGLLELVSQPHDHLDDLLSEMQRLHQFVARRLSNNEMFWALSMPPPASEDQVQIADFGPSASGRMKQVYRQGLAARYGKIMQIISGVHFNFSVDQRFVDDMHRAFAPNLTEQGFRNQFYFRLIRGVQQHAWLLPYLFGASPVAAKSSLAQAAPWLKTLDTEHVFGEYATSLRMSDIGYQSPAQSELFISHANLDDYVRELVLATRTPWPDYQKLGVREGDRWIQLNANILQIENEYYSAVRPKQIVERGERPACALKNRGVSYIEVRMLDVDPFDPLGISRATCDFMQVFMISCLAWGERPAGRAQQNKHNRSLAIRYGRDPKLELMRDMGPIMLRDWADECLDECAQVAQGMDLALGGDRFETAVSLQREKWRSPDTLPSQQVLDFGAQRGYHDWACELSRAHSLDLARAGMSADVLAGMEHDAAASIERAGQLQAAVGGELEAYIDDYFSSLCDQTLAQVSDA